MVQTEEERKAKRKEVSDRPENKAKAKLRSQTPEYKVKKKEYYQKNKERIKEYGNQPDVKSRYALRQKKYRARPEIKLKNKKYNETRNTPERRIEVKTIRDKLKIQILSEYSKRHSNSDIPCCNCCGENSHTDFLNVDHIDGKKHLPQEEQKLGGNNLNRWLKRNNYPDGFQILCWNCNLAKGLFGVCPHKEVTS